MAKNFNIFQLIASIFVISLLPGCDQKGSDLGKEILIRVGDRVVTVLDFNTALEIAKTVDDHNIDPHSEDLRKAKLRLLNELTVEMILLERAEEIEVSVTDAELEKAVAEIKSDYPEGEFEETLLEFAVSYDSWKNRLRTRLIMEKVIEKELKSRISVTAEEIAAFYKKHYQGRKAEPRSAQATEDINESIVNQLRREKTEEKYESWIEELKGKYIIEINNQLWEEITGSKSTRETETNTDSSKRGQ